MTLKYLHRLDPHDSQAVVILEAQTIGDIRACVKDFWSARGFEVQYCRFLEIVEDRIIIDFGHYARFYQVLGFKGTLKEFASEWESR